MFRRLFKLLLFLFVLGLLAEATGFIYLASHDMDLESARQTRATAHDRLLAKRQAEAQLGDDYLMHPYLGVIARDRTTPRVGADAWVEKVLARHRPGDYNVLLLGGSMPASLDMAAQERLAHALTSLPWIRDREVNVFNGAMRDFKQPQQLQLFSYLLGLGAKIDMVINVDGFNEVALTPVLNPYSSLFFPSSWNQARPAANPQEVTRMARERAAEDMQAALAERFRTLGKTPSHTVNGLWLALHKAAENYAAEAPRAASVDEPAAEPDAVGYRPELADEALTTLLADHWARTSKLMADMAASQGILYVHVLQPSPYAGEAAVESQEDPYAQWATVGYQALRQRASVLKRMGVVVLDASDLFAPDKPGAKDEPTKEAALEGCCALTEAGARLLVSALVRELRRLDGREMMAHSYEEYLSRFVDPLLMPQVEEQELQEGGG